MIICLIVNLQNVLSVFELMVSPLQLFVKVDYRDYNGYVW